MLYDGSNIIQISDNVYYDTSIDLDNGQVVWSGWDADSLEIYHYDGTSTTQITDDILDHINPKIDDGNIVWETFDGFEYKSFFYDGTTVTKLTIYNLEDKTPHTQGGQVVWSGWDGNDYEIFLYDGSSITQLTDNEIDDLTPYTENGNVVWAETVVDIDSRIMYWDGSKATVVSVYNDVLNENPILSNNEIVWEVVAGHDIRLYDGEGSHHVGDGINPSFDNGQITWEFEGDIYIRSAREVTLEVPEESFLHSSVSVTGDVLWPDGTPFQSEPIMLYYQLEFSDTWVPLATTSTDSLGSYRFEWDPDVTGKYMLKVSMKKEDLLGFDAFEVSDTVMIVPLEPPEEHVLVKAGWQMISLPYLPSDARVSSVLSELDYYQVVTWDGTQYVDVSVFEMGKGYWLLSLQDTVFSLGPRSIEQRIYEIEAAMFDQDLDARVSFLEEDVIDILDELSSGPDYDSGWLSGYTGHLTFYHDLYTTDVYFVLLGRDQNDRVHQINYPGETYNPWEVTGAYVYDVDDTSGRIHVYNYSESFSSPYDEIRVLMWSLID